MTPHVVCVAEATLHRIKLLQEIPEEGLVAEVQYIGSVCTTPDMRNGYLVLNSNGKPVFVPKSNTTWIDKDFFEKKAASA